MTVFIEMVSDLVCPWCWLGLRRIEAARLACADIDTRLVFRPFELDPAVPAGGVDYRAYMAQRFGGDAGRTRAEAMRAALISDGETEGLRFRFDTIDRRPNSFDAHRLVLWAQGQGKGAAAKEALFAAYFSGGHDIGDRQVLAAIGASVGLNSEIVSRLLETGADTDMLRDMQQMFRNMGVAGVPTFIANRRVAVQGAESAETLARFIRQAAALLPQERPAGPAA